MAAAGGRTGLESLKTLGEKDFQDRTIVFALDFFFWDSTLASPEASLKALDRLLLVTKQKNVPLVLGNIPELLPGRQPSQQILNQALSQKCCRENNCYVMKFDELYQQVERDGFLIANGQKLSLKEIVPDGLHLSERAGNELALRLEALLNQTPET